jgi:Sec-independent protein translocase protein TatA
MKNKLTTLPADVHAEIEKRLPEVSKTIGVSIQDFRIMIAGMVDSTAEERNTENLTTEVEAEFLIHISMQALQQFTGSDI